MTGAGNHLQFTELHRHRPDSGELFYPQLKIALNAASPPPLHDAPIVWSGGLLSNSKPQTKTSRHWQRPPPGKSRRSYICYRNIASPTRAPRQDSDPETQVLSPLSLPIGYGAPHSSGHKHPIIHENANLSETHFKRSPRSATAILRKAG